LDQSGWARITFDDRGFSWSFPELRASNPCQLG
jgi:hypothetical protein